MNYFTVFFKKELMESVRTYKLLIMLTIFLVFGIMNPLTAKLTPDLLNTFLPEGVSITLPEPTSLDSWAQFFKNVTQMGLIVTVLVFSGILANEITKGTLINLLTKGMPRQAVLAAKYAAMLVIWSASVVLSFLVTWVYTVYLFPDGMAQNLLFSVSCLWAFGAFLLAVLLCASTIASTHYSGLLVTGAVVVVLTLLNAFPAVRDYNPLGLASKNMALVSDSVKPQSFLPALGITLILSVLLLVLAVVLFRKKRI